MTLRSTPSSVYPLATKGGQAIPLDVARPITGWVLRGAPADAPWVPTGLPPSLILLTIYSSVLTLLEIKDSEDAVVASHYIAPGTVVDLALELPVADGLTITALEGDADIVINRIQRWTQLDTQTFEVS